MALVIAVLLFCWYQVQALILQGHPCAGKQSVSSYLHYIGEDFGANNVFGVNDGVRDSVQVVEDPHHSGCYVLKVNYDKGSHSCTEDRAKGVQYFIKPKGFPSGADDVSLSYQVLFDPKFDFVKGGKLPGTFGYSTKCSGGRDANHCISTRFMWRANGVGELYLYFPKSNQVPTFIHWEKSQHNVDIDTNDDYGVSFRNSHFVFRRNYWTTLRQRIHLNSVRSSGHGNPDGWLAVWFDGAKSPTFNITNVVLRKYKDVHIDGIFFNTFFGGHDSSWSTPHDTYTLFRNIYLKVN